MRDSTRSPLPPGRPRPADGAQLPHIHARERATLAGVIDGLDGAGPVLVTVSGLHGTGQRTLVRWAAHRARTAGLRVLHARARPPAPPGAARPYGVVAQLLAPLRAPGADTRPAPPEGGGPGTGNGPHGDLSPLLRQARREPTVLAVEDMHRLPAGDLDRLQALLRRADGSRLALVCGGSEQVTAGPDWAGALASAAGPAAVHDLSPEQLDQAGTAAVVGAVCGAPFDDRFAAAAHAVSRGRTCLLLDILRQFAGLGLRPLTAHVPTLRTLGTAALGDHLIRAAHDLGTEVTAVVRALAVCGEHLDPNLVCALAGARNLSEHRLAAVLARTAGIRALPGGRLTVEPALRARVLEEMAVDERRALHARAAELAHRAGADDGAVADLLLGAHPVRAPWAGETLRRAARQAVGDGLHDHAVTLLSRAQQDGHDRAGDPLAGLDLAAAHLVAEPEAGVLRIERTLRAPGPCAPRAHAADLGLTVGSGAMVCRAVAGAVADPGETGRDVLLALLWAADPTGQAELGDPVPAAAAPLPRNPVSPAQSAVRAWQLALHGEDLDTCVRLARAALAHGHGTRTPLVQPVLAACRALCAAGLPDEAEAGLDGLLAVLRGSHLTLAAPEIHALRGEVQLRAGRLAAAARDLHAAEQALAPLGRSAAALPYVQAVGILVESESGRGEQARIRAGTPIPSAARNSEHWPHLLFARGVVALREGRPAEARDQLWECGRRLMSRHRVNPAILPWRSLAALACHGVGALEEARRLSEQEVALARRWNAGGSLAWARVSAALVDPQQDRLALVRSALAEAGGGPAGPEYVRVLAESAAAEMTEDGGDRRVAAGSLAELGRLTALHPAAPMAVRARVLARAGRPGTAPVPGWEALSPAEEQTALLAGRGRSNRDIAAALRISSRAVELRLTRVYHKLRIDGRRELRALVREMGGHRNDAARTGR
ncbi:AAA family ATPase [Streptomyces cacaoi]